MCLAAYVFRSWIHEHFGHSYWRLDKMPKATQRWKLTSISHKTDPHSPLDPYHTLTLNPEHSAERFHRIRAVHESIT
jgi:hypothetical protein